MRPSTARFFAFLLLAAPCAAAAANAPSAPAWLLAREAVLLPPAPSSPAPPSATARAWREAARTLPHVRALALRAVPLSTTSSTPDPATISLAAALDAPYRIVSPLTPTRTARARLRYALLRACPPGGRAPQVLRAADRRWLGRATRLTLARALADNRVDAALLVDALPQPWLLLRNRSPEPTTGNATRQGKRLPPRLCSARVALKNIGCALTRVHLMRADDRCVIVHIHSPTKIISGAVGGSDDSCFARRSLRINRKHCKNENNNYSHHNDETTD